jgi:Tol biopolymer transport system component
LRFIREARAVAALNHPNIVTIHGIESADGIDFIVLELVAGRTLHTLISRRGMNLADVLRVAIPLVDALATAHGAGIVHRDLKPANVMVTPNGVVKVLDFGLAKLTQPDEANVAEATTRGGTVRSRPGAVVGTAGYMSPEQAAGEPADVRSDVFSVGVVLYEMVTGQRAFAGSSSAETLAAVLRDEPKLPSEIVPGVPKELERIVERCLRKDPERRFQSMRDVKIELQELADDRVSPAAAATAAPDRRKGRRATAAVAIGAVVLTTTAAVALWRRWRLEPPAPRLVLLAHSRTTDFATFSPDGSQIAFGAPGETMINWDVWLKIVGEAETRRLTTDPAIDGCPAWSPDGRLIAFVRVALDGSAREIHLISPLGGPPRRLGDFPARRDQLSWSPDGRWLAAARVRAEGETTRESGGIHLLPASGGAPRALTFPSPPTFDQTPALSPDGRSLAYFSCEAVGNPACDLRVLSLDAERRPVGASRRLSSERVWSEGLAWTRDGRSIVYGVYVDHLWRVRADGTSPAERVELAGPGAQAPFTVTSRDRLGFLRSLQDFDIHRYQVGDAAATPLIASSGVEINPQYSPDGRRIAFESAREGDVSGVWLADADGSNPTRLTRGPGRAQGSPRWSPTGRTISFDAKAEDGHWDVWTIGVDGSGPRQLTHRATDRGPSSWSRDGRFVYFNSERTGRQEIWRIPATGGFEEQVTHEGGFLPFESPDGRTLYYKREERDSPLMARPTVGGDERRIIVCVPKWGYAVGPEGLFHLDCISPEENPSRRGLRLWNAATGQDRLLATLDTGPAWPLGLSVSPDGRSVLFLRYSSSLDVMMIENFR